MFSSIKARIIAFYLIVLFVALFALGGFLSLSLGKIVYHSIDSNLTSRAKALASLINEADTETEFDISDQTMWDYNSPKSESYFQIRRPDGSSIEKSTSLGTLQLPRRTGGSTPHFETILLRGMPARVVTFYIPHQAKDSDEGKNPGAQAKQDGIVIQCAEIIQKQVDLIRNYGLVLLTAISFVLIISATGAYFIAGKALVPLEEISAKVGRMSASNLSERIGLEKIPAELRTLATSFNHTFDLLENSFNLQRQFTSDAAHELRTPLSVILSQSEITLRKERTPQEYKNALATIEEAGTLMSSLVTKLLILARLSAVEIRKESMDLGAIMGTAVRLLRSSAESRQIEIAVENRPHAIIEGDPPAVLELFVNLLDNSIKYTGSHGTIDISLEKEDAFFVIRIRDTGIGIAKDDLKHVFERFYRVDKSRSKDIEGVGLGLSICQEIAELHGGRIGIESQVGRGTDISVYFPMTG